MQRGSEPVTSRHAGLAVLGHWCDGFAALEEDSKVARVWFRSLLLGPRTRWRQVGGRRAGDWVRSRPCGLGVSSSSAASGSAGAAARFRMSAVRCGLVWAERLLEVVS